MSSKNIKKYIGVDWGEKRIGLALADSETRIATPFKVAGNLQEVMAEIKKEEIDVIVVGKPLQISNLQFPISKQFGEFVKLLKKKINIPVKMADERLSSKAADALSGTKKTNPPSLKLRRARAPRDAVAAMLILQGYLDKLNMKKRI